MTTTRDACCLDFRRPSASGILSLTRCGSTSAQSAMALDVKAGVASAVTSCGVETQFVDVDSGGGCLSRCRNQERSSSCETGDDNGANAHLRPRGSSSLTLSTCRLAAGHGQSNRVLALLEAPQSAMG
jgi:hypothetical protein